MLQLLFIAIGGALGAMARYGLATAVHGAGSSWWPLGTLLVNGAGSLLIGVVFVLIERAVLHPDWRSVLMVGFLGAFTTFSTYSLETVELWLRGQTGVAVAYALGSVVLCVAAAAAGVLATRAVLA
jgi:CrcB protein